MRKKLESDLFVEGSKIEVDAQRIKLPGFLIGVSEDLAIRRDEIESIWIQVNPEKGPQTLNLQTTRFGHALEFWQSAVDGDLRDIGKALQQYMIKPCEERTAPKLNTPIWVFALIFLIPLALMIWFFKTIQ